MFIRPKNISNFLIITLALSKHKSNKLKEEHRWEDTEPILKHGDTKSNLFKK